MDQMRRREIQVGITVTVAMLILIGGLMFFKNMHLKGGTHEFTADFTAVEGLKVGDRVQVRGIRSGTVTAFDFMPQKVRVHFDLDSWIALHDDASVTLVQKGIVGEIVVEIDPGTGTPVAPGHEFQGRNAASIVALGDKVNKALDEMTSLSEEVRGFIGQLRTEGDLVGTLATAQRTLLEVEGMVKENRSRLRDALGNVVDLTESLSLALGDGKLDSTLVSTRQATAHLDSAMAELVTLSRTSSTILKRLEAGEGSAGRLLTDEALYDQADSTLQSLDRLLDQMRRNPKAFFKVSVF